jgi:hypothetical protein
LVRVSATVPAGAAPLRALVVAVGEWAGRRHHTVVMDLAGGIKGSM